MRSGVRWLGEATVEGRDDLVVPGHDVTLHEDERRDAAEAELLVEAATVTPATPLPSIVTRPEIDAVGLLLGVCALPPNE